MKQLPFFIISSTPSLENIAFLKLFFLANSKKIIYIFFWLKLEKINCKKGTKVQPPGEKRHTPRGSNQLISPFSVYLP